MTILSNFVPASTSLSINVQMYSTLSRISDSASSAGSSSGMVSEGVWEEEEPTGIGENASGGYHAVLIESW